jgi:histidine ammonia-lyase
MSRSLFAEDIRRVVLDGHPLTLEELVAVARYRARVSLGGATRRRVTLCRAVVDRLVAERAKVYGLTTGFGSKRDILIAPEELAELQLNLIRSHACGVGDPLPEDVVRAAMLLRANTLARGLSGVRVEVVEALLEFLNRDVYPWIPSRGSLGASGDLAPLSHLALALLGDPEARFYRSGPDEPEPQGPVGADGTPPRYVANPVPWRFGPPPPDLFGGPNGMAPLVLQAKEGLGLNNGTQITVALGALSVHDAMLLLESAELVCALSLEATMGVRDAFDPRLHAARPLDGQGVVAAHILAYTDHSQVLTAPINTARVHRAQRAVAGALDILEREPETVPITARIRDVSARLDRFEEQMASLLHAEIGPTGPFGPVQRDRLLARTRDVLAPIRGDVLKLYAAALDAPLPGEAQKGRDFLADAVAQLQLALPEALSVQDDYSFRCTPQVLGAVRKVIEDVRRTLEIEAQSATDNPLIFPPDAEAFPGSPEEYARGLSLAACLEAVVSGGNFHGEPIAMALDHLSIALAEMGNISERRTAHLVDGNLSNGLPSLLVWRSGLMNGLMIPQYVAAALVSENKVLAHPASVDSIPTCENTEDHVSMSALAALKCRAILKNVESVIAIELLTAWQGVHFRRPLACGRATERLWQSMGEAGMTPVLQDRVLAADIEWTRRFLQDGHVSVIARECMLD